MAAPITTQKSISHTRSISLPSAPRPTTSSVEEHLYRLRATGDNSTPSSSSVSHKLNGLKDLYDSINDMIYLTLSQQSFPNVRDNSCVEDMLEGSLRLLDICGTTKDIFSQMKASVQDLESSLWRRRGEESDLANEISRYMVSRKKVKKLVVKCIGNMKRMEKHLDRDCSLESKTSIPREVEIVSFSVLESLLSIISKPKASRLSFISQMIQPKRVACEGENSGNEVENIDIAIQGLKCHINFKQVQGVLKPLESLELNIQEIEEELDCVLRRLIKTRVTLLNILNH